jgi:ribosomal protein S18 acetylase RimI-like enzyme
MNLKNIEKDFPKVVKLKNGTELKIRIMKREDKDTVLEFYKKIPEEDKEYLRVDIKDAVLVEDLWLKRMESGKSVSLLAFIKKELVGLASLHQECAVGSKHIGYFVVNVAEKHRGIGIGAILCSEIDTIAIASKFDKIYVEVVSNQTESLEFFRKKLGFHLEAVLPDHVLVGEEKCDLIMLATNPVNLVDEMKKRNALEMLLCCEHQDE